MIPQYFFNLKYKTKNRNTTVLKIYNIEHNIKEIYNKKAIVQLIKK